MRRQPKLSVIANLDGSAKQVQLGSEKFSVTKVLNFWCRRNDWWQQGAVSEKKFWRICATSSQNSIVIEICYDQASASWQLVRKFAQ